MASDLRMVTFAMTLNNPLTQIEGHPIIRHRIGLSHSRHIAARDH